MDRTFFFAPWRSLAACRDQPTDDFFTPRETLDGRDEYARARACCHHCPVAARCLAQALTGRERFGVWGGLDPTERAAFLHSLPPEVASHVRAGTINGDDQAAVRRAQLAAWHHARVVA